MNLLEEQAQRKIDEAKNLKSIAIASLKDGSLNENNLNYILERTFVLGHNAGHCRGEQHKNNL